MTAHRLAPALLLLASLSSFAQPDRSEPLPRWEIGLVSLGISQLAYPGSDQQVQRAALLPFFIYRGQWLRADEDGAGLRAVKTQDFELDISLAASLGASRDDLRARQGMPRLGTLVEAGPLAIWKLGPLAGGRLRAELPVRAVFDLSDKGRHKGWASEPELNLGWRLDDGWRVGVSGSLLFGDRKLTETFYGVPVANATAQRAAYAASAGLISTRLGASFSKKLSRDWQAFGFARLDTVAGSANRASPLVKQTNGWSVGLGVSWTAMRSSERGVD